MVRPVKILKVNSRKQITLGKLAQHENYVGVVDPDGTIRLVPVVVRIDKVEVK